MIVQPHNRGTAHGILLPLLQILSRDPDAHVTLFPADHYVYDEGIMAASLRRAGELARVNDRDVYLLGVEPEAPDTELGYIVPGDRRADCRAFRVAEFVEKPSAARAQALLKLGALWNTFIITGSIWALLRLFDAAFSSTMVALSHIAERRIVFAPQAFDEWYAQLPSMDFSRDVLQAHAAQCQVFPVPRCGWTDLGTPSRIGLVLRRLHEELHEARAPLEGFSHLSLADQYARLDQSGALGNSSS